MLTVRKNYITMLRQENPNILLPDWFLSKFNCANPVDIDQRIKKTNELIYPNPTFLGHNALIEHYKKIGWNLTWRKIKKYHQEGLVRTKPVKILAKSRVIYDPNNPEHQHKELADTVHYAVEDFEPFLEKDKLISDEKLKLKKGVYNKKGLWRDFLKDQPDLSEIEAIKDSLGTFYSYLAISDLVEKAENSNLSENAREELRQFLQNAIKSTT